ncbi:MAG: S1/P1 nuclease [Pseudolabrys sp.]|nr:S1/P1 nuclease [Pseudolabrys sp.]
MSWTRLLALSMLAVLCVPLPALAWGADGHAIVADIAEPHLTPAALRRVTEILRGERMRDVASYADQ